MHNHVCQWLYCLSYMHTDYVFNICYIKHLWKRSIIIFKLMSSLTLMNSSGNFPAGKTTPSSLIWMKKPRVLLKLVRRGRLYFSPSWATSSDHQQHIHIKNANVHEFGIGIWKDLINHKWYGLHNRLWHFIWTYAHMANHIYNTKLTNFFIKLWI